MKVFLACMCAFIIACASCASNQGTAAPVAADSVPESIQAPGQIPIETRHKVLHVDGAVDEYIESEYDDSLSILLKQYRRSASGALLEQFVYLYQDGGNHIIKKTTLDADNRLKNVVEYQYTAQGLLQSERLLNKDSRPVSSFTYFYDSNNNRTKRAFNNGTGDKLAETIYSYDGNGNNTVTETFSGAGQKIISTQRQYNSDGQFTDQRIFNSNGQLTASTKITWQGGKEIKDEQFGPHGALQMRITNEYGPNGELLRRTIEDLRGNTMQILAYEYTYKPDIQ